jgi:hypothetical protein
MGRKTALHLRRSAQGTDNLSRSNQMTFKHNFKIMYCTGAKTFFSFLFFVVLGFELRAYTLTHSTGPFLWWDFSR